MTAPPRFSQSSTPYSLLVPSHPPHALSSLATLFPPSARGTPRRRLTPDCSGTVHSPSWTTHFERERIQATLRHVAADAARCRTVIFRSRILSFVLESHSSITTRPTPKCLAASRRGTPLLDTTSCPPSCQRSLLGVREYRLSPPLTSTRPARFLTGPDRLANFAASLCSTCVCVIDVGYISRPIHPVNPARVFFFSRFSLASPSAFAGRLSAGVRAAFRRRLTSGDSGLCGSFAGQESRTRGPITSGGEEIRTPDPLLAKQVLYQLSYAPSVSGLRPQVGGKATDDRRPMWAYQDSNLGPQLYQSCALAN